jgi:hypothetical protein
MNEPKPSFWHELWNEPRRFFFWSALLLVFFGFLIAFYSSRQPHPVPVCIIILVIMAFFFALAFVGLVLALIPWTRPLTNWLLQRRFFVLASFITAIALFYAEENWRGKHDFEKFKREQEAKGEKFTLAELAPPPVPDDQNFAMTPIVASCYSREIDRNGHKIIPPNTNIVNRLWMDIGGQDAWPTNTGGWQMAKPTSLEAWQAYYRTLAAKTNLFPVAPQPQSPAADVLLALSRYDSAVEELRQAARLADSRFPLEYDSDNPSGILLPHLASLKACVQMLRLRACAELQLGQTEKAFDDTRLMFRLTEALRSEPILISHLVRIAEIHLALQPIWEGIAEHRWSDAQLAGLDDELQKLDFLSDLQSSMRGERAFALGTIEWVRSNRGYQPMIGTLLAFFGDNSSDAYSALYFIGFYFQPEGWSYQNELTIASTHQRWLLRTVDPEKHLASPQIARDGQQYIDSLPVRPWNFFSRLFLPSLVSSARKFAFSQCTVDLARTACALERYRLAHGSYPGSLDVLAPQFIDQVPHDLINGQPLHYRRKDDGYVLYSVGWNEKDDGGVAVPLGNSAYANSAEGDWVWQVPAKTQ